jgi:hypothetical protein
VLSLQLELELGLKETWRTSREAWENRGFIILHNGTLKNLADAELKVWQSSFPQQHKRLGRKPVSNVCILTGPRSKAIFLKSARGLQKARSLSQGVHNSVVRREPEIYPG